MSAYDVLGKTPFYVAQTMDKMGWTVAAQLMRLWYSKPANANPKKDKNETIVTMKWALGFNRAKKVYDELYTSGGYKNAAAKKLLEQRLKAAGLWDNGGEYGDVSRKASAVEKANEYINSRTVKDTPLDDMGGALGRFQMRIAPEGKLVLKGGKRLFCFEKVGLYIIDSYDFNGSQFLGWWDFNNHKVTKNPLEGAGGAWTRMDNGDFRKYRKNVGKGGDFTVYSDIQSHVVTDVVDFSAP